MLCTALCSACVLLGLSTLFSHAPFKIRRTSSSSPSPTDGADNTRLVTVTSVMLSFVIIVDVVVVVVFCLFVFSLQILWKDAYMWKTMC